jgi:hypothetical protein
VTAEQIAERLDGRRVGGGWLARCPGLIHTRGDRSPSLSVGEGRDGRVLVHCFAGCTVEEICAAAGIKVADLFASPRESAKSTPPLVHSVEQKIADLRSRLTPRERAALEPTVILTTTENLDAAIYRGLALAVEGELCQIVMKERQA